MIEIEQLSPDQLLNRCRKRLADGSHEVFCFEMFRRAIVQKSQACWSAIYEQYRKLVYAWVIGYARANDQIGSATVDEMVLDAFSSFWRSYDDAHLAGADGLASVLSYLNSCAWSSVQRALRDLKRRQHETELDLHREENQAQGQPSTERSVLSALESREFWSLVESCCNDDREVEIMRLRFVDGWKPVEIIERRPNLAQDVSEIYKILRNLKDRMSRNLRVHGYTEVST